MNPGLSANGFNFQLYKFPKRNLKVCHESIILFLHIVTRKKVCMPKMVIKCCSSFQNTVEKSFAIINTIILIDTCHLIEMDTKLHYSEICSYCCWLYSGTLCCLSLKCQTVFKCTSPLAESEKCRYFSPSQDNIKQGVGCPHRHKNKS